MVLKELLALKFTPWYRWHPQIAMRYLPIVEGIESLKRSDLGARLPARQVRQGRTLSILEVGSGGLGIAPYLRMSVTGADREFEPPFHPLLKRVKGDATNLKFRDDSFDVVISMDMLEHLPKRKREKAVSEMMRVARKLVIIGVPCGKLSMEHDISIAGARSLDFARDDGDAVDKGIEFLEEQVEYGLPEEIDILHYIKVAATKLKKQIKIEIKGNMNLRLRSFLMRGWMSGNILVNILFRKVFLLLVPMFRWFDGPPFYRKIFFISVKRSDLGVRQGRTLIQS